MQRPDAHNVKVQLICHNTRSNVNGIGTYCNALADLFEGDDQVQVMRPVDCPLIETRLLNNLFKWKPFYKALKDSDADVLQINGYTTFIVLEAFIAARLLKKNVVYLAHWHPYKTLSRPLFAKLFFNLLVRPFLGKVKAVVTLNAEDTQYFSFMGDKVHRIPHWNRLSTDPRLLETSKQKDMVLFVGRFNADNKGFEYLFDLPEGKYDIHCVGKGDVTPRGDMTLHTNIPVDELMGLYARASVVVIPSKYEAFSYVCLEALSLNTPVVMSDRVRIGDYVRGCQGVSIFRYGDHKAFAQSVANTIGTKVDRDGILAKFSPDDIKARYARLFRAACAD